MFSNISILSNENKQIIARGDWLTDEHMEHFNKILTGCSNYKPQETFLIQLPDLIKPVPENSKHIQILHSCSDILRNIDGHWVCSYYDSKRIYIYDSMNSKKLHKHHETYLKKLFPFYDFEQKPVQFPNVQSQPNGNDCGVFAIAFAVSLVFNIQPEKVLYNHLLMRQHLIQILETNCILHFPRIVRPNDPKIIPSLKEVQRRQKLANKQKEKREKESNEQRVNRIEKAQQYKAQVKKVRSTNLQKQTQNSLSEFIPKDNNAIVVDESSHFRKDSKIGTPQNVLCKLNTPDSTCRIVSSESDALSGNQCLRRKEFRRSYNSSQIYGTTQVNSNNEIHNEVEKNDNSKALHVNENNITTRSVKVLEDHNCVHIDQRMKCKKTTKQKVTAKNENYYETGRNNIFAEQKNNYYNINKNSILRKRKERYELKKDDILKKKREQYKIHTSDILRKRKALYEIQKDDVLKKRKISYQVEKVNILNAEENNCKLGKSDIRLKQKQKCDKLLKKQKKYNNAIALKISKKYRNIALTIDHIKMKYNKERYIRNITKLLCIPSLTESRLEAERIVKWCVYTRNLYISQIKKTLKNTKRRIEVSLTRSAEYSGVLLLENINVLCGQSRHTVSSESYFADSSYNPFSSSEAIVINSEGKAMNVLPLMNSKNKRSKAWHCSSLCKTKDLTLLNNLKYFFQQLLSRKLHNLHNFLSHIYGCSNKNKIYSTQLGHTHGCYINHKTCQSKFLPVEILSPHFPEIRYIKRLVHHLIHNDNKLYDLDKALNNADVNILQEISNKAQENIKAYKENIGEINLSEDDIISQYHLAFKALTKRSMDTPRFACVSCEKLCFERDVMKIKIIEKIKTGNIWSDLMNRAKCDANEITFICRYCYNKVRYNEIPPTCILNKLNVPSVPDEIKSLNDYERILIQRAKAFQVVQRMGTVMKKNMPRTHMIPKVKGRTFHLPLPLEETLKKICSKTSPLNLNHELYILVRGIPTKSNTVWENLVDVKKVWDALVWLKNNNLLYSEIILPETSAELLRFELSDTEIQEQQDDLESDEEFFEKKAKDIQHNDDMENHTALLTQMSQSDPFYENLTIYPMYDKRVNESPTTLYQMVKVRNVSLHNNVKDLDLMCFPDLYPYGINGQHEDRSIRLTDFEYIKSRLMSKNSQFRLNIQYIFYLLNDNNIRQLNAGIFHKMNVTNPRERYTVASYLEKLSKQELETNLNTIFSRLRNTEQYWRKPRNDLICMTHHYGPATWFLTLSPSEWMWTDLIEYLREVNGPSMAKMPGNKLIASDPVSTSRFIDNKFKAMLDFICSSDNPIGEVTHYFWRREYQGRGTQHFHLLIWIKDAPILGKATNDEVASFLLKYVTCRIPNKDVSPELYRRVITFQNHVHNTYCLRNKKTKTGFSRVCRFGFSRPTTDKLIIKDVAVSIAGRKNLKTKSRLYDLPRAQQEVNINDYNPAILTAWKGNMDMQYVGEISTFLTSYTTKYISKSEKSYTEDTFDIINSTKPLRNRLWNVGMRMLHHRECGALEAADTLLGISLHGTDPQTTIRWIDVNMIRSRKLKSYEQIKALNPDSTDIFCPSLIDSYYPNRPAVLESLNLYDFAKSFDITTIKPKKETVEYYKLGESLYIKKRKRDYLINHYKYNVHTQPECYYFSLLLLFKPWRDINELKNECGTYAEAFLSLQSQLTDALQYHERILDIQQALEHVKEQIQNQLEEIAKKEDEEQLECVPIEAEGAMRDFKEVGNKFETVNVDEMIAALNFDQKRVFDKVTSTLMSDNDIMRLYVSGEGGTGKSFLIKTIRCWIKQNMEKDTAVTAPTGIAAFNIDGLTVHRLFQLPVEHGHTAKYTELSDSVLNIVRNELKNVILIIIDEVSMISNITFMYIHLRLSEIFDTKDCDDGWFGKKHILLFGDLLQLPPVHEDPAFIKLSNKKIKKYIGALGSVDLWSTLFSYDELGINMRQQGDHSYRDMLSRIRIGTVTDPDIKILESRKLTFKETTYDGRLEELCEYVSALPADTVCLFPTCAQCDIINTAMLCRIPSEEIQLIARDIMNCAPYLKKKVSKLLNTNDENSSRTAGLARIIVIKIGARIMIRRNIDISLGLVNGAIATVIAVTRTFDGNDIETIKVKLNTGTEHTIERLNVKFELMNKVFVMRQQFPICLSYGITIHKSQGLSLKTVVIEAGNSIFSCGQTYVALSRVTTLQGLHLINYDPSSVKANDLAIIEYNTLRKKYRPDLMTIDISKATRVRRVPDVIWSISDRILECQSEIEENFTKLI